MRSHGFRIEGGIGSIVGGLALLLGHLFNLGGDPTAGTALGTGFVLVGHIVLVFAFVGLYARQTAVGTSLTGRVGMVLSIIGTILVAAIVFVELAGTTGVDTTPVFEAAGTAPIYTIGPLVFVLGLLLVGSSIARGVALPRWSGVLLIVGTVVFAAASGVSDFTSLLTVIGAALTAGGFVWSGVALFTNDSPRSATVRGESAN
ncbi:MAG TPA: hypothetical protein VFJ06_05270 [Halococcus sp.]|nr:hypothetical protein [Halococcus sp.]